VFPSLAHRTVRCATGLCPVPQGPYTPNSSASGFQAHLRYNSSDCPVYHRTVRCTSGATAICAQRSTLTGEQCSTVTQQKLEQKIREAPDCPVWHRIVRCRMRTKPPTVDQLQALMTGWRGGGGRAPRRAPPPPPQHFGDLGGRLAHHPVYRPILIYNSWFGFSKFMKFNVY
jgi:hypothetical protein